MKPLNEKIKAPKKAVRIESKAGVIKEDFITLGDCSAEIGTVSATVSNVSEIDVQAYYIKCVCAQNKKCVYLRKIGEQTRVFFAVKTSEGRMPFLPYVLSEYSLNELLLGKDRRAQDDSLVLADRLLGENELKYISAFMPDEHPPKRKKGISMALSDDEGQEYTAFYWKNGKSVPCADIDNIPELFEALETVVFNDIELTLHEPAEQETALEEADGNEQALQEEVPESAEIEEIEPEEVPGKEIVEENEELPTEISEQTQETEPEEYSEPEIIEETKPQETEAEEEIEQARPDEQPEETDLPAQPEPEKPVAPKKKEKPKKVGFFERRRRKKQPKKKKVGEKEEDFEHNEHLAPEKIIEEQPKPVETAPINEEPDEDEISAEESEALAAALSVDLLSDQELDVIFENPFEDEPEETAENKAETEEIPEESQEPEEIEENLAEVSGEVEETAEKAEEIAEEAEIISDETQVIEEETASLEEAKEEIKEEKLEIIEEEKKQKPATPKKKEKPKKVGFFERRRIKKQPKKKKVGEKENVTKTIEEPKEVPIQEPVSEPEIEQAQPEVFEEIAEVAPQIDSEIEEIPEPVIEQQPAENKAKTEEIPEESQEPEEIEENLAEVSGEVEEITEKSEEIAEETEIISDEKEVIEEETASLEEAKEEIKEELEIIEEEKHQKEKHAKKPKEKKKKGLLFASKQKKKKDSDTVHSEKKKKEISEELARSEVAEELNAESELSAEPEEKGKESLGVEEFFESEKPLTLLQILEAAEINNENKETFLPYMKPALLNTVFVVPITDNGKNANEIYVSKKAAALLDGKPFETGESKELVMPDDDRIDLRLGIRLKTIMSSDEAFIPAFTDLRMFEQIFGKRQRAGLFTFPNLCKQSFKNEQIKGIIINPEITDLMLSEEEMMF